MYYNIFILILLNTNSIIFSEILDISINVKVNKSETVPFNNTRNLNTEECLRITSNTIVHIEFTRIYLVHSVDIMLYNNNNESIYDGIINITCFDEYFENKTNYVDGYYISYQYYYILYYVVNTSLINICI